MPNLETRRKRIFKFQWPRRRTQKMPSGVPMTTVAEGSIVDAAMLDVGAHEELEAPQSSNVKPVTPHLVPQTTNTPFRERRIGIAIDRSGSTWNGVLDLEINLANSIRSLLSPRNEFPLRVLFWNHAVDQVIDLTGRALHLPTPTSEGGTDPRALYKSSSHLQALKCCDVWLLLTDGEISDSIVEEFARDTAHHGMHGSACIIVVFGPADKTRPIHCNISVGVALYAMAPNCLFSFFDIKSGKLYNLQSKGCFRSLLPDRESQVVLDEHTRWTDLATVSLEHLQSLEIPEPVQVSEQEMALQGQLRVNMNDLYGRKVPQADLNAIVKDDDNLKSIVMAEMMRGRGDKMQNWLSNQYRESPTLSKDRPDLGGRAQTAITSVLRYIHKPSSNGKIERARTELRNAHQANWKKFQSITSYYRKEMKMVEEHNKRVHWASSLSADMDESSKSEEYQSYSAQHISSNSCAGDGYSSDEGRSSFHQRTWSNSQKQIHQLSWKNATNAVHSESLEMSSAFQKVKTHAPQEEACPDSSDSRKYKSAPPINGRATDELFFPGFQIGSNSENPGFVGICDICQASSILTLLLKAPPKLSTPGIPEEGSQSLLAFPLAMADFAELDIISRFIACEACALYLVRMSASVHGDRILDALPIVPIALNDERWLGVLNAALRGRFRTDDLPCLFVAMLDRLGRTSHGDETDHHASLQDALQWAKRDLLQSALIPSNLSASFDSSMAGGSVLTKFANILSHDDLFHPERRSNPGLFALRYPLPGFAVIIRLLRDRGSARADRELLTWHRFVYHLADSYFRKVVSAAEEDAQNSLAKLLGRLDINRTSIHKDALPPQITTNISPKYLASHPSALLDQMHLSEFETLDEFNATNDHSGFATAVFLHHLFRQAPRHTSPTDVFNTIKAIPSMITVMLDPFGVTEPMAKSIISGLDQQPSTSNE